MSNNNLSTLGWKKNRTKIETSYRNYLQGGDGAEGEFFKAVTAFAKSKMTTALFDSSEGTSTVEDKAQDVAVYVWSKLSDFRGEPDAFYPWLNRICYTTGASALNSANDDATKRVEMFVEDEESGDMEDNPEIYQSGISYKRNGKVAYQEPRPQYQRDLPEFIQGTDLYICEYIREGYDYEKIGRILAISEDNVEIRVRRMREKVMEMKNAKG